MNEKQTIIDFLKDYHPSTPATYKIATSLLAGLNKTSLEELALISKDQFIRYRAKRQLAATVGKIRNTPMDTLLPLYTNKKSGKVVSSRVELFRRFPSLDPDQQKCVAKAFFESSASDARKMATYLMGHWDDMFLDIIETAWLDGASDESLAKLVIRYHRLDFVMSHIHELEAFNGPMLAVRRCQAGMPPKIDDWPLTDYLAIIYNSGMAIEEDEAAYLMSSYLVSAALYDIESGRVPDYTRKSDIEHPSLIFLEGVRLMVYYLGCMGLTHSLSTFEEMDNKLCSELGNGQMKSILAEDNTSDEDKIIAVWRIFCEKAVALYDNPDLRPMKVKMNSDATPCIVFGGLKKPVYADDANTMPDDLFSRDEDTVVIDGIPF